MRKQKIFVVWIVLAIASLACQTLFPAATPTNIPTGTSIPPTSTDTPTATSTLAPIKEPTSTATSTIVLATSQPADGEPEDFVIRYHPDGGLYVGDLVSIEVIPMDEQRFPDSILSVYAEDGTVIDATEFGSFGIGGRYQATLTWAWNTAGLEAGEHTLTFIIESAGIEFQDTVTLQLASEVPFPEPQAGWKRYESDCCLYYTISGTAADRDIETITEITDMQAASVTDLMGVEFEEPVEITLLPRVLGHGGFARGEIFVTYSDRKYAGGLYMNVIHHEMVHILDSRLESEFRPTLFVEGLAVYLTGGHFKQEELIPRAAALLAPGQVESGLGLDWYIPMEDLADQFYTSQHEIGYLQAGALIEYMIERWGYDDFNDFYRSIPSPENGSQLEVIDLALIEHFGIDFAQLEVDFIERLQDESVTENEVDDVRLLVEYYDTARRYQQLLDTSAYFLTAWLPNSETMREDGIVADFLRHPEDAIHISLETMLVFSDQALQTESFAELEELLIATNQVLDAIQAGKPQPFSVNPLAEDHFAVTQRILETGYEPFSIDIELQEAFVMATYQNEEPSQFFLTSSGDEWIIQSLSD